MFYTSVASIVGTERDVRGEGWASRRLVLAREGLPFSVHETTVTAGSELRLCYRNHSETVYCIDGRGSVEDLATRRVRPIEPGTLYTAGVGDDHLLRIEVDTRFLCIFAPPLEAREEAD